LYANDVKHKYIKHNSSNNNKKPEKKTKSKADWILMLLYLQQLLGIKSEQKESSDDENLANKKF